MGLVLAQFWFAARINGHDVRNMVFLQFEQPFMCIQNEQKDASEETRAHAAWYLKSSERRDTSTKCLVRA